MPERNEPGAQRRTAGKRAQARAEQERQQKQRQFLIGGIVLAAVVILIVGGGLLAYHHINGAAQTPQASASSLAVDGVQCLGNESLAYHIHQHLTLYQDGKPVTLPAFIGIPTGANIPGGTCYYWLHVHDTTGVVHVESPTTQNYTLGQFLDVWERTTQLDAQGGGQIQVSDAFVQALRAANPNDVHVYLGDQAVTDYKSIPLTPHALITIEIGAPLVSPPTNYTFPTGE